ncbi:hypothetical protein CEXT_619081 [Caerostris extrusa]|uniref:Uncharacterized protein n=1 Tax=Caerostris extrusa TaxID=172846 RepID=A0AAV4XR20_CAEEX|nr:hypothetical protein CEXT_619081 [Caerostris extrusa]
MAEELAAMALTRFRDVANRRRCNLEIPQTTESHKREIDYLDLLSSSCYQHSQVPPTVICNPLPTRPILTPPPLPWLKTTSTRKGSATLPFFLVVENTFVERLKWNPWSVFVYFPVMMENSFLF